MSEQLSRVRRRDTAAELAVRSLLHKRGLRFRVEYEVLGLPRRRVDIAFPRLRLAVFIDGCFWHGCPEHYVQPKANAAWWREKIAANQKRDAATDAALNELGWSVLRIWEHEAPAAAAARIEEVVGSQR